MRPHPGGPEPGETRRPKGLFDSLVRNNPMRIEVARFRRRFLGQSGSAMAKATLVLAIVCYVGLLLLVIRIASDLPPIVLIMLQTGVFCFFGPAMLHGSIAGERERRSWDLLMVAPISKAQIVVGKYMGAMAALAIGAAAMAVPILLAASAYGKTTLVDLLLAEGVSLAFCLLVCAWSLLVSARSQRPFTALGITLGTMIVFLVVLPMLLTALLGDNRFAVELAMYLNPFTALGVLAQEPPKGLFSGESSIGPWLYGLPHLFIYLALAATFLVYAEKTLNFPENEVKFAS